MRRRRRQTTQTIRKKNLQSVPSTQFTSSVSGSGKWRRGLLYLFFILVAIWGMYYLYQKNFKPDSVDKIAQDTVVTQVPETEPEVSQAPFEQNVQIEILNGCGVNGIARVFQSFLRQNGFDVVNTENYIEDGKIRWDLPESMIIDYEGNSEKAREVARVLRISPNKIVYRDDPGVIYNISVVLGKDYKKLLGVDQ